MYLIGAPGSGKTTLAEAVFDGIPFTSETEPIAHQKFPGGVALGLPRESFGGTDSLPMNVQPKVVAWIRTGELGSVFGEGDRLANDKFFRICRLMGVRLTVAYLWVPANVGKERRKARGSKQNPSWVKGRISKAHRLFGSWGTISLDGRKPVDELAGILRTHPTIQRVRGDI